MKNNKKINQIKLSWRIYKSMIVPCVLAVGLELVFGPPNPRREGLIVGKVSASSFIVSWILIVSVVFDFGIVEDESVASRSVRWWLWLSHLDFEQ